MHFGQGVSRKLQKHFPAEFSQIGFDTPLQEGYNNLMLLLIFDR